MRLVFFGLLAMLTGGAPLFWGYTMTSRIRASSSWPTVEGNVVSSRVKNDSTRIRGGGYNRFYIADVRYAYDVGGRRYESSTHTFGVPRSFSDPGAAAAEVATRPVGFPLKVYYDPDDPEIACLAPGEIPSVYSILFITGGIITLIGLVALAFGIRSLRNRRPRQVFT